MSAAGNGGRPDAIIVGAGIVGAACAYYLSLEGMVNAVEEAGPYCTACFSGDYTAPLVDVERGLASPDGPARC